MQYIARIKILLIIAIPALLLGCSRGSDNVGDDDGVHTPTPNDTSPPVISVAAPATNQAFTSGNAISISGNVSDDYGLYQGYIKIVNDANGLEYFRQPYVIHGIKSYNFNISPTITVTTATDFTVSVVFEDHGYNTTTQSVKIKVNP